MRPTFFAILGALAELDAGSHVNAEGGLVAAGALSRHHDFESVTPDVRDKSWPFGLESPHKEDKPKPASRRTRRAMARSYVQPVVMPA
jgi:hypothetical protein